MTEGGEVRGEERAGWTTERRWFRRWSYPTLTLAGALLLNLGFGFYLHSTEQDRLRSRFATAVQLAEDRVLGRLETYLALLRAGRGLVAVAPTITRAQFARFHEQLEIAQRYPGIQGLGFSRRVLPAEKEAFEARMRASGRPDFRIFPEGDRAEYHAIELLEPMDRRNLASIGYDMATEPGRAEAMRRASETGAPAASRMVSLVQEIDHQRQPGFLIYVAVYRGGEVPDLLPQRREDLLGYIYSPFRAADLFEGIFGAEPDPHLTFQVFDGEHASAELLLYDSHPLSSADGARAAFEQVKRVPVAGRIWTVVYRSSSALEATSGRPLVLGLVATGVLVAVALFGFARAQAKAREDAEERREELLRSEAAARASRDQLDAILTGVSDAILASQADGRLVFANQAAAELAGYPGVAEMLQAAPGDFLSRYTLLDDEGRPFSAEELPSRRVLRGESGREQVFCGVERTTGERRWVSMTARAVRDLQGQPALAISILRDITTKRRGEEVQRFLLRANEVLSGSLEYEETLKQVAALAVPRLADWCGVDVEERTDQPLKQVAVAHVDPRKVELARKLRALYPTDPDAPSGTPYVRRTGKQVLLNDIPDELLVRSAKDAQHLELLRSVGLSSVLIAPMRSGGRTLGALTFAFAQPGRRFDAQDVAMAQSLADRAAVAIEHARLFREAREAVMLRDEFLSIASHELRTPLTPLKLQLTLLARELRGEFSHKQEKLQQKLDSAVRQTERLTGLVENLLDVSRIAGGQLHLEKEPCDLAEIAREICERFRQQLEAAGCALVFEQRGEARGIWDRLRIEQVVTNLLTNAIKYGAGKPVRVRVARGEALAVLQVTDEGIGIPPEAMERIFERFERAVSASAYGGLGLGLYISRRIVDAHGGRIWASSEQGKGSTFGVELPL